MKNHIYKSKIRNYVKAEKIEKANEEKNGRREREREREREKKRDYVRCSVPFRSGPVPLSRDIPRCSYVRNTRDIGC